MSFPLTHVRYYRLDERVDIAAVRQRVPRSPFIRLLEPADEHARSAWSCALHVHASADEVEAFLSSPSWREFDAWLATHTVVVKHWNLQETAP